MLTASFNYDRVEKKIARAIAWLVAGRDAVSYGKQGEALWRTKRQIELAHDFERRIVELRHEERDVLCTTWALFAAANDLDEQRAEVLLRVLGECEQASEDARKAERGRPR